MKEGMKLLRKMFTLYGEDNFYAARMFTCNGKLIDVTVQGHINKPLEKKINNSSQWEKDINSKTLTYRYGKMVIVLL